MFVSKVAERMKDKKVTVRELVKETGLSLQTVTNARDERIASCSLKTLGAIAKALGCSVKDLFEESAGLPKWAKK